MATRRTAEQRLRAYARAYRALAAQIAETDYLWPGSISSLRLTCGQPQCACHRDPARRHGPYLYWSTKVKGRTVSQLLKPEEAELYRSWIENRKKVEKLQREMIQLSRKVAPLLLRQRRSGR